MKLQLLIPQFNETDEVMRPMLESIGTQQGVDLKNDIEVLIGNDGSDIKLSEEFLGSFSYSIRYEQFDHIGLPGTRGRLFDLATADYVMFCDADDMFLTNIALYTIFAFIDRGFDALVVDFMEEVLNRKTGRSMFFPHKRDSTFVHGKIYRRQFLLDNGIVWHPDVKCHEDSGYNCLALKVAKDVKYCRVPLYLWKWREGSICRKDPLYVPKTYTRMIYSNGWLVKDFLDRGMVEEAKYYTAILIYGTYYMLNKPIWLDPMNAKYRYETEKCFQDYYRDHKILFQSVAPKVRNHIIAGTKRRVLNEGVLLEKFTFDEWIRHIETLEYEADMNVLIIGVGTVGGNLSGELATLQPQLYDKYKNIDTRQGGVHYDAAFVCVDTPGADCDISEVRRAVMEHDADVFVIKSTVLPGTTERLSRETGKTVIFSPEYYGGTQHCNNFRFPFTILGGKKEACVKVVQILQRVYDGTHSFRITDSRTAELAKYMENSYLAMKVSFCQQFYDIAGKAGVCYEELRELFVLDPRVEASHTFVYRDRPYWDSHCLNKDVPAIAKAYDAPLLLDMIAFNEARKK